MSGQRPRRSGSLGRPEADRAAVAEPRAARHAAPRRPAARSGAPAGRGRPLSVAAGLSGRVDDRTALRHVVECRAAPAAASSVSRTGVSDGDHHIQVVRTSGAGPRPARTARTPRRPAGRRRRASQWLPWQHRGPDRHRRALPGRPARWAGPTPAPGPAARRHRPVQHDVVALLSRTSSAWSPVSANSDGTGSGVGRWDRHDARGDRDSDQPEAADAPGTACAHGGRR